MSAPLSYSQIALLASPVLAISRIAMGLRSAPARTSSWRPHQDGPRGRTEHARIVMFPRKCSLMTR